MRDCMTMREYESQYDRLPRPSSNSQLTELRNTNHRSAAHCEFGENCRKIRDFAMWRNFARCRDVDWRLQGAYKQKSSPIGAYKALTSRRALRLALTSRRALRLVLQLSVRVCILVCVLCHLWYIKPRVLRFTSRCRFAALLSCTKYEKCVPD